MSWSSLQVDHTKRLHKPRTCYIVMKISEADEKFVDIATVQSNDLKARAWIHDNPESGFRFRIRKEHVV